MLQSTMALIAYVASDTLQVFVVCNLIILLLIVVSSISSSKTCSDVRQHYPAYHPFVVVERTANNNVCENTTSSYPYGSVDQNSISVKEEQLVQNTGTDEDNLRLVEVPQVLSNDDIDNRLRIVEVRRVECRPSTVEKMRMLEGLKANTQYAYENKQSLKKAPRAQRQTKATDDELLRLDDSAKNSSYDQIIKYVEDEVDEFRQQVEEFIGRVTEGWKAEKRIDKQRFIQIARTDSFVSSL